MDSKPLQRDFAMPAEWQPHEATWMAWPRNVETWPHNLADACDELCRLIDYVSQEETVRLLVGGDALHSATARVGMWPNVELIDIPTDDAWVRDYGPTFVVHRSSGELAAVDWNYNGWGEKYPPFQQDQQVARRIAQRLGIERFVAPLTAEGGALEINARGWLMSTRSCLGNPNRNPQRTEAEINAALKEYCAASRVIWLAGDAVVGDDTDGHIDQLARFVDDQTIVYAWTDDEHDPQRAALEKNLRDLQQATGQVDSAVELIPLPLPDPVFFLGHRLPASYLNFYISNHSVWVPRFGAEQDDQVVGTLAELFPDRSVQGLPALNLTVGLGAFHCLTQQQPQSRQRV